MAQGDVTLTRREHRELLDHLAVIKKHHTKRLENGVVVEPSFPHDAEVHEDVGHDDPLMSFCPQCEVITRIGRIEAIHDGAQQRTKK